MRPRRSLWAALAALTMLATVAAAVSAESLGTPGWLAAAAGVLVTITLSVIGWLLERQNGQEAPSTKPEPRRRVPAVHEVRDRLTFNIHAAIPLNEPASEALSDVYPTYIQRDIDITLRAWLKERTHDAGLVVLVGPTAAGKSRTLFEALHAELRDWRLRMPTNGTELDDLIRHEPNLDSTVILLEEMQDYFTSQPLTAHRVKSLLLGKAGRVLIAATIRPVDIEAIVGPQTGIAQEMNKDADQVMKMLADSSSWRPGGAERAIRLDLKPHLSTTEQARAAEVAQRDPRVAQARDRASEHAVIPTLAGTTELIRHWTGEGNEQGQAVITAAVIARRCGHPDILPEAVLVAVGGALLAGRKAAPDTADWFPAAAGWAQQPVRGQITALRQVRTQAGRIDGYYVSDILVGHSIDEQHPHVTAALAADTTWRQLIDVATHQACGDIGSAAYRVGRREIAESAWARAADRADKPAMRRLALLLYENGERTRARYWLDRGVAEQDPVAMTLLASIEDHEGRPERAEALLAEAVEQGDIYAMGQLGFLLRIHGRGEEAESWYARAAESGDANAMTNLGYAFLQRDDLDGAESWTQRAAGLGHAGAMQNMAVICRRKGDITGRRKWLQRAAETGYALAKGDRRRIDPWPGEAGDEGISNSILEYAAALLADGDPDESLLWYRRGSELGDSRCAAAAAALLDSDDLRVRAAELAYENLRLNRADLRGSYGHDVGVEPHLAIMRTYATTLRAAGHEPEALLWDARVSRLADPNVPAEGSREVWHPGSWRWRSEPI
ncbi:hypothetical protein GCM10009662_42230 [Catellatospora coxensis]|uniref:TPR repeat protein n=2 Tax=Catellatospora coxensis TaxID=310354 RepID=A0A8J3KTB4_9ACTN|nr:hypothetical protein Cco03nite_25720 [Catellatospora coxensis]